MPFGTSIGMQKKNKELKLSEVGKVYPHSKGGYWTILEYHDSDNVIVVSDVGTVRTAKMGSLRRGQVKDSYQPYVEGVGYTGEGRHSASKGNIAYTVWRGILDRGHCNMERRLRKYPTYVNCSVAPVWHNFQTFADWYEERCFEGCQLDKDIACKDNLIYAPEKCHLITAAANSFMLGNPKTRGTAPLGASRLADGRFKVQCKVPYKSNKHIGLFETAEEAFEAYASFKENLVCLLVEDTEEVRALITTRLKERHEEERQRFQRVRWDKDEENISALIGFEADD